MRKAYSYLRFSTPEQAKGDSHRRQAELASDYARRHDLDLDDKLTFHDLGVSAFRGANAETGKLGEFRQAVEQGHVPRGSALLVESLDRISRQAAWKALRVLGDIAEAGVTVVTLSDNREYDADSFNRDPMSIMMALLVFIRANEESEMKSRRLKASWAGRRAKAAEKPITSRGPAWLRLGDDRAWTVIEDRAEVVRRIFTLAASGAGELSIAATLNRDGVATWGDNGRAPAIMWHKSYVSKVLRSRAVIGTLVPFTMVHEGPRKSRQAAPPVQGYYPAIVSDALWSAVATLKQTASPLRGRHAVSPIQNVLGGLARCSECGRAMTRVYKGTAAKAGAPKLVCTGAKTGAGCEYRGLALEVVEEVIRSDFVALANGGESGEVWSEGVAEAREGNRRRIEEIDFAIEELISGKAGLIQKQAWGLIKKLGDEKEVLLENQGNLSDLARDMAPPHVKRHLAELEKALSGDVDRSGVNVALRQLFSKVVVCADRGTLAFHWKTGQVTRLPAEETDIDAGPSNVSERLADYGPDRYVARDNEIPF